MSKKKPGGPEFGKKRKPVAVLGALTLLLTGGLGPGSAPKAAPGGPEELALPRAPYGATFDGANFWTTDIQERRLIRLSPGGRSTSTFLGRGRIYGVDFNPNDGHLYVGAERRLLRVNPVTAGKTDTVAVPVKRVAGVAFSGPLWYLLEKGTGNIQVYEPGLLRTIRTLSTGRAELRDIAVRGGNLWATDGKSGVIYRYRLSDWTLTGSLRAPVPALRGLCFREGQLWIVDRNRRALVRLPYVESEYAIVSGERRYEVNIEVRYTPRPNERGNLVLLVPHGSASQQPTALQAQTPGWRRGFTRRGRPVLWMPAQKTVEEQVVRYSYRITTQNARWYIPDSFTGPTEILDESLAAGYVSAEEAVFNAGNPFVALERVLPGGPDASTGSTPASVLVPEPSGFVRAGGREGASVVAFVSSARKKNLPARWGLVARLSESGRIAAYRLQAEAYLRGPGWVPVTQPDPGNNRLFASDATEITLLSAPDGELANAGALFVADGDVGRVTEFRALPARLKATIARRGQ